MPEEHEPTIEELLLWASENGIVTLTLDDELLEGQAAADALLSSRLNDITVALTPEGETFGANLPDMFQP